MPRPARTDNPANVTVYLSEQAREALAALCKRDEVSKGKVVARLLLREWMRVKREESAK